MRPAPVNPLDPEAGARRDFAAEAARDPALPDTIRRLELACADFPGRRPTVLLAQLRAFRAEAARRLRRALT